MKYLFTLSVIISLALLNSCGNKEIEYKKISFKVHKLPLQVTEAHKSRVVSNNQSSIGLYLLNNRHDKFLKFYNFKNGSLDTVLKLDLPVETFNDVEIYNNQVYTLLPNSLVIQSLHDSSAQKKYRFYDSLYTLGVDIGINNKGIFIHVLKDLVYNSVETHKICYTSPCDARMTLTHDSLFISDFNMNFPTYYQDKIRSFYSFIYQKLAVKDDILYSFDLSNELYVKSGVTGQLSSIPFKSNYYKAPKDFDTSKMNDPNYYQLFNPINYGTISYNPSRKEYYRVMLHETKEISSKGFHQPWSLIVGDENLRVKYEIVFEGSKYINNKIVPTEKGFAVFVLPNDLDEKNQLILHEYELTE